MKAGLLMALAQARRAIGATNVCLGTADPARRTIARIEGVTVESARAAGGH